MFIYFLQKHYVIQNDINFLLKKYEQCHDNGENYYKDFCFPLFFYGFARRDTNPKKQKFVEKYGHVKYLNGGLFYPHHIEKKYALPSKKTYPSSEHAIHSKIDLKDKVIKEILEFLNGYS